MATRPERAQAAPDYTDNAGWHAWNMSKRISTSRFFVKEARLLLEAATETAPPNTLTELRLILADLEAASERGNETWGRIQEAMRRADPTLIDPPEQGVSVIHNHGPNRALMDELWRIWGQDTSVVEARELFAQFLDLVPCDQTVKDRLTPWVAS